MQGREGLDWPLQPVGADLRTGRVGAEPVGSDDGPGQGQGRAPGDPSMHARSQPGMNTHPHAHAHTHVPPAGHAHGHAQAHGSSGAGSHLHGHTRGHAHDHPAGVHTHVRTVAPYDPAALISARGLMLARAGHAILSDIDIDIAPGEIVTVIGPNGAGKTTLVRVLLGLEPIDGGEIRRKAGLVIGYAPQRFDLDRVIPLTVARFVSLGRRAGDSAIAQVLADVGAGTLAQRQLSELSGGELQRVVLARALIRSPDLLVLDEPVRGVDYAGEAELYTLIGRLRTERGFGVLLVSHDLHVVMAQSDRVICLNRHVCCSGVPQSVAQHPEYARLFGPEAARAFALYHHQHDHSHDLAGAPQPAGGADGSGTGGAS
jgi:zinc transport system ATP-binding protein